MLVHLEPISYKTHRQELKTKRSPNKKHIKIFNPVTQLMMSNATSYHLHLRALKPFLLLRKDCGELISYKHKKYMKVLEIFNNLNSKTLTQYSLCEIRIYSNSQHALASKTPNHTNTPYGRLKSP